MAAVAGNSYKLICYASSNISISSCSDNYLD